MFKRLFDFSYQRSFKEALGFYIFYILLVNLIAIVFFSLAQFLFKIGLISLNEKEIEVLLALVMLLFYLIAYAIISILIVTKRNLKCFSSIALINLGGAFLYFFGDFLGFIPLAILSTFPNKNLSN